MYSGLVTGLVAVQPGRTLLNLIASSYTCLSHYANSTRQWVSPLSQCQHMSRQNTPPPTASTQIPQGAVKTAHCGGRSCPRPSTWCCHCLIKHSSAICGHHSIPYVKGAFAGNCGSVHAAAAYVLCSSVPHSRSMAAPVVRQATSGMLRTLQHSLLS